MCVCEKSQLTVVPLRSKDKTLKHLFSPRLYSSRPTSYRIPAPPSHPLTSQHDESLSVVKELWERREAAWSGAASISHRSVGLRSSLMIY